MPASQRLGLAVYPAATDYAHQRDAEQWVRMILARDALLELLGGAGIWQGLATDPTTTVAAGAGTPLVLCVADTAGHLWPCRLTSNSNITFNVTSGATVQLYAVIDLKSAVSPDMAVGGVGDVTFVADTAAAPDNSLLLGEGAVTASAFTSWTEDAGARVQAVLADPAAMGNANGEIAALTFSATPTQAEAEALRDKCEELADDVRVVHAALTAAINALQARALVSAT